MKICSRCRVVKPLGEYQRQSASNDGFKPACKACTKVRAREWAKANPDKVRAKSRKWAQANPEKVKQKSKTYYVSNAGKLKAKALKWWHANPDKKKAHDSAYYKAHSDKVKAKAREWKQNNPDKVAKSAAVATRRRVEAMAPSYVAGILKLPVALVPSDLLALKREQLTTRRLARQLKEKVNEAKSSDS